RLSNPPDVPRHCSADSTTLRPASPSFGPAEHATAARSPSGVLRSARRDRLAVLRQRDAPCTSRRVLRQKLAQLDLGALYSAIVDVRLWCAVPTYLMGAPLGRSKED